MPSSSSPAPGEDSYSPRLPTFNCLKWFSLQQTSPRPQFTVKTLFKQTPKQNTFAHCTPTIECAERVLRLKKLVIDTCQYEILVYCAPDESQGRGEIRGADLRLDRQSIQEELQDTRNPPIADFRRQGNTTIVLFSLQEPHVFTWIYLCNARHHCNMYKKKFEECYQCSELGHRADVCTSTVVKCRGCPIANPTSDH
ncbi:hypothetical protein HPB51_029780 [Rhipicephalus microplus]|uniref:CCHC-type domain-containing protein n=1 Tax=Rhipicephalus microplus TaxID=6941 RepID=A0A9J6CTD7_RHIMP|nr:hypothetical protein HPB51_029780 [Rhipicephalus microplus]